MDDMVEIMDAQLSITTMTSVDGTSFKLTKAWYPNIAKPLMVQLSYSAKFFKSDLEALTSHLQGFNYQLIGSTLIIKNGVSSSKPDDKFTHCLQAVVDWKETNFIGPPNKSLFESRLQVLNRDILKCTGCDKLGHYKVNCPEICTTCSRAGHHQSNCNASLATLERIKMIQSQKFKKTKGGKSQLPSSSSSAKVNQSKGTKDQKSNMEKDGFSQTPKKKSSRPTVATTNIPQTPKQVNKYAIAFNQQKKQQETERGSNSEEVPGEKDIEKPASKPSTTSEESIINKSGQNDKDKKQQKSNNNNTEDVSMDSEKEDSTTKENSIPENMENIITTEKASLTNEGTTDVKYLNNSDKPQDNQLDDHIFSEYASRSLIQQVEEGHIEDLGESNTFSFKKSFTIVSKLNGGKPPVQIQRGRSPERNPENKSAPDPSPNTKRLKRIWEDFDNIDPKDYQKAIKNAPSWLIPNQPTQHNKPIDPLGTKAGDSQGGLLGSEADTEESDSETEKANDSGMQIDDDGIHQEPIQPNLPAGDDIGNPLGGDSNPKPGDTPPQ
ncbi:Two-component response regulator-like PRR37 [Wickerhamomyces ciferrii]|uniref:Two-component response regulator-like PRR37 n=1 Tax=Wickerhamomyces ciferrii (strain ATCC 14091 / BCRC 22168 / CBS 111 / JCM 3599 / NBRC 0793 / NRRL Y-1031 F-60-10) TaxID=1206466 RepID=K0L0Q1_WICCF|nr:Two-component response regulator-like PRR37 [Wickerhamomyces ciferrii]CCH47144.1 Two-component response regulator-like PRR37 [Wickerhamomyces ciferrii]